jgi:putative membrane protein
MNLRAYRAFQALIMAGLGIYLFSKVMDGRILLYINRRFVILVLLAALGFIFLAQLIFRERQKMNVDLDEAGETHASEHEDHPRQGWMLWLVALPLIIGVLAPERSLSVSALQMRGINTNSTLSTRSGSTRALDIPSTERSVLDWIRAVSEEPDEKLVEGQTADVTGFVYHDLRLGKTQFMVGRFSIACCVADAVAIGMIVNWPEAAGLPQNQWVRVRGIVRLVALDGKSLPGIDAQQINLISEPEQPYLFP